jgi:hypothetical protein
MKSNKVHGVKVKAISIYVTIIFVVMFSLGVKAQEEKDNRKEKKEQQKKEQEARFQLAKAALYDTNFVIPADNIALNSGQSFNINNTINFLRLSRNEGALQISAYLSPVDGLNNIGELYVKGPLTLVKFTEKKERLTLNFTLNGQTGKLRITVTIFGTDKATVYVDGFQYGPQFQLNGLVQKPENAQIYEKRSF